MAEDPVVSGLVLAGRAYSLRIDVAADGLFLIDADQQRVAYLSQDNGRCALESGRLHLAVQRQRLAWQLAMRTSGSKDPVGVSRPRLWASAYRINDASNRRLSLSRGRRVSHWNLKSERGPIARLEISELMLATRDYLKDWLDGREAAEITVLDGPAAVREPGPLVLLAIATIRAEMTLPAFDNTPAG